VPESHQQRRLPREFFDRPATQVAPDLLGCVLWHDSPAGRVAVRLVEAEAYEGLTDPASHAFRGQTARNAVMFGPPGHVYVYFTYGMHFCVNLVCLPPGQPSAVLLRAGEVIEGAGLAAYRRTGANALASSAARANGAAGAGRDPLAAANGRPLRPVDLARGPARLCQALDIDRSLNGADVCAAGSPLGVGPAPGHDQPRAAGAGRAAISTGPRVGIRQATERPWRFWLAGDDHVSVYRPLIERRRTPKPGTGRTAEDGTMQQ